MEHSSPDRQGPLDVAPSSYDFYAQRLDEEHVFATIARSRHSSICQEGGPMNVCCLLTGHRTTIVVSVVTPSAELLVDLDLADLPDLTVAAEICERCGEAIRIGTGRFTEGTGRSRLQGPGEARRTLELEITELIAATTVHAATTVQRRTIAFGSRRDLWLCLARRHRP
jgi:hypothetical protein